MRRLGKITLFVFVAALIAGRASAGPGLNGAYYNLNVGSVAQALADAAITTPFATFTATTVCFPSCFTTIDDSGTIGQFLGGNAIGLTADQTGLGSHVLILTGELNIATTGSYNFYLGSDDGSQLFIDSTLALSEDGAHPYSSTNGNFTLTAGQHSVEIVQYENGGVTGLTVAENFSPLGGGAIATGLTLDVPEPATAALVLAGVGCLVAARRAWGRKTA